MDQRERRQSLSMRPYRLHEDAPACQNEPQSIKRQVSRAQWPYPECHFCLRSSPSLCRTWSKLGREPWPRLSLQGTPGCRLKPSRNLQDPCHQANIRNCHLTTQTGGRFCSEASKTRASEETMDICLGTAVLRSGPSILPNRPHHADTLLMVAMRSSSLVLTQGLRTKVDSQH